MRKMEKHSIYCNYGSAYLCSTRNDISQKISMFTQQSHEELVQYIRAFDGIKYCKTRNYINGGVTKLSPYITHGVITTKEVIELFLERYTIEQAEMLFKELLRREYFVQVHYWKGDAIFADMEEDKTGIEKA